MLTIQYLEDSPNLAGLDKSDVVKRLRNAAELLPISHLLIGWHIPQPLLEACRLEAERLNMRFLRWQPLLTTDKDIRIDQSWYTKGLAGNQVQGYRGLPEFTFLCPNHPGVQEVVLRHLEDLLRQGFYQGFFLDRIRYPSPSVDPENDLACFCEHCHSKAALEGLDLGEIHRQILKLIHVEGGRLFFAKRLLSGPSKVETPKQYQALDQFLAFRQQSIHNFLDLITQPLRASHMEIGLDCFSPSLAHMVGQDLIHLSSQADWVKLMTYIHTLALAGLPYELMGLLRYLTHTTHLTRVKVLDTIGRELKLPMPPDPNTLETQGLSPEALGVEIKRGLERISSPVLAGIELVDLPGITNLNPTQIREDLAAIKLAHPAGLALSWDLLHISQDNLKLVREKYITDH